MSQISIQVADTFAEMRIDTGAMNIIGPDAAKDMRDGLRDLAARPDVSVLVLRGRDDAFSAGLDLGVLGDEPEKAADLLKSMGEALRELAAFPVPTIAVAEGHAVAAGAMLLMASTLRIGVDGDYRVGLPEVAAGMPLPAVPLMLAQHRLSPSYLERATLMGEMMIPRIAVAAGFLDQLAPADRLVDTVNMATESLGKLNRDAYAPTALALRGPMIAMMDRILAEG